MLEMGMHRARFCSANKVVGSKSLEMRTGRLRQADVQLKQLLTWLRVQDQNRPQSFWHSSWVAYLPAGGDTTLACECACGSITII